MAHKVHGTVNRTCNGEFQRRTGDDIRKAVMENERKPFRLECGRAEMEARNAKSSASSREEH